MKVYLKNHKSLLSFFDRPRKHNISQSPKKNKNFEIFKPNEKLIKSFKILFKLKLMTDA
jgi:hypothetical protein